MCKWCKWASSHRSNVERHRRLMQEAAKRKNLAEVSFHNGMKELSRKSAERCIAKCQCA